MKIIKEKMEQTVELDVPLVIDIGFGNNWLEGSLENYFFPYK